ncbi:MAG: 4-hydroxybenzoate polyprenyltransferase [Salibacteraceae bacterium]|jgi:4-hydroxybenzoate polyprenyltransferase
MKANTPQITHLFRPINLVIIILTMVLLKYGLMEPMLRMLSEAAKMDLESQITPIWFSVLICSVVFIAAGGYILNDIKDQKTDAVNHNGNPVGSLITIERANSLYQITTVLGLALSFLVAFHLGNYNYGIIQLTAAISLWFYSHYFKTEFLSGNFIVAFVVALVPLTVGIYEVSLVQITYFNKVTEFVDFNFNFLAYWFISYAAFVFLITLIREIIKDVEDITGDKTIGANTLPIALGEKKTKALATLLFMVAIYGLVYVRLYYLIDAISSSFILIEILLVILNIVALWKSNGFLMKASTWTKIISVVGVLFLGALGYIIDNQLFFNV